LTFGQTRRDVVACGYGDRTALGAAVPTIGVSGEEAIRAIAGLR
jgi:hypothetical protein